MNVINRGQRRRTRTLHSSKIGHDLKQPNATGELTFSTDFSRAHNSLYLNVVF